MSSPPSSASLSEVDAEIPLLKSKSNSPDRTIAFLVHSPDSISNNLPPDCDNKPLARQRRRRTSPDDQRVLEQAFARNPRPSKEERQEIIRKVALGDKEVQIWFQNRRQSSRRKIKPLETHEIEEHLVPKSSSPPASPIEHNVESGKTQEKNQIQGTRSQPEPVNTDGQGKSLEKTGTEAQDKEQRKADAASESNTTESGMNKAEYDSQETVVMASITSSQDPPASTFPTEPGSSQGFPSSSQDAIFTSITRPTYLANRRNASFARQHAEESTTVSQTAVQTDQAPSLRKSGSYLRLSMTEDGQARVIDRSAPSPPRSQPVTTSPTFEQPPTAGLRRSYSAAGLSDLFKQSSPEPTTRAKVPRVSQAGRSRDSRAWEFWCDSEARNSLANKAEQENSGSAADAIGLIRQSSRNALRPNSRKANSPMVGPGSFNTLNASKPAKPKLQRASTTHGRLQQSQTKSTQSKKGTEEQRERSPSGDSDKENWDPEDNQSSIVPRGHPQTSSAANPRRRRTILGENTEIPSYQTSLGGLMDSEKKRRAAAAAPAVDAEVAAFMGAGNESEDLDCVQSLLSLSKGNWR